MKAPEILSTQNLRVGDVVRSVGPMGETPYSQMTVTQADNETVTFFRPYVKLDNFTYLNEKVISYIGQEIFSLPRDWHSKFFLIGNIYHGKD